MHLILILDGFGYEVVKSYKNRGGFEGFHEPSKIIAPYPTLTDLCIQDLLQGERCDGLEAVYFDRQTGRMAGSTLSYLQFKNQPYAKNLDYRGSAPIDAICYASPWLAYHTEITSLKRSLKRSLAVGRSRSESEMLYTAYLISTAGISTKYAEVGQTKCLQRLESFLVEMNELFDDSLKITLLSDHGHSYCASRRSPIEKVLKAKGWRFENTLNSPKDLVYTSFGLVNYASFATRNPRDLATDLHTVPGVELTSFLDGEILVVFGKQNEEAHIKRCDQACSYEAVNGDPLGLKTILDGLPRQNGFYGDDDVFAATIDHTYPAPLERLWRAHHDIVKNPEDVIASLGNEWHSGSRILDAFATVRSTHGSLNQTNSQAFAMSTEDVFPPALRSREVLDFLRSPKIRATGY